MDNVTIQPVTEAYINRISALDIGLTIAGSSLSVFGAILLFFAHFLRWKHDIPINETRKYLLFLTFADFCNAAGYLWGVVHFFEAPYNETIIACHKEQKPACVVQSFVTTLFSMSSFFWTTVIAINLYFTSGLATQRTPSLQKRVLYHFSGWMIPLAIVIVAVFYGVLGSDLSLGSGAWCWISACLDQTDRTIWMTFTGKGWEILMYLFCFAFYILIKWEKKKRQRHIDRANHMNLNLRNQNAQQRIGNKEDILFLYLWIFEVGLRIFGTVRYIMSTVRRHTDEALESYTKVDMVFLHFQSFGDTAQAFTSCILFCFLEKETRDLLKNAVTCRKGRRDEELPIINSHTEIS